MSESEESKSNIIVYHREYLSAQNRTLNERISDVKLSEEEAAEITAKRSGRTVRDAALGIFKVGQLAKVFIDWNENIDKDIKEAKRAYLIENYLNKSDEHAKAISKLNNFITDPHGNTLFNKILRIMDDNPPDEALFAHLSETLFYISNNNFARLFEQHRYALAQIDQMTPQSLLILGDFKSWPRIHLGSYSSDGGVVTSDWNDNFAVEYAKSKGITDNLMSGRMKHSVSELISRRFVEARLTEEKIATCYVTEIGDQMLPYIAKER